MVADPFPPPSAESLALRHEIAAATQAVVLAEVARLIAHEINQPLAAVAANAGACLRWLEREPPNVSEAMAAVRRLTADAHRAAESMRGIQALVQRQPPARSRERVRDLADVAVELVAPVAAARGVRIAVEVPADLPTIDANRAQMLYVLVALLTNACEALERVPEPRSLRLSACRTEAEIEVAVRDNGPGLGALGRERHFEPFFTAKPGGLGLGLAVSRAIVESHGGKLSAAANDGQGESFLFTLPATA